MISQLQKREIEELLRSRSGQSWYQRFEVVPDSGVYTPGWLEVNAEDRLKRVGLSPEGIRDRRVLDVGADAGGFSFYLEDCGAEVVALDSVDPEKNGFNLVKSIRGSTVQYRRKSVYELDPNDFGRFDYVAMFAVLQLLKNPLLALDRINSICNQDTILFGQVVGADYWFPFPTGLGQEQAYSCGADFNRITKRRIRDANIMTADQLSDVPLCGFVPAHYESASFFVPNRECLNSWLIISGFEPKVISVSERPRPANALRRIARQVFKKKEVGKEKRRPRARLAFKARYAGTPFQEYGDKV